MKILFSTDYGMGIGDFIVKIYAICHLNKFLKENFQYHTIFVIEEYQTNILTKLLNIPFFNQYFDEFYIQKYQNNIVNNLPHNNITFNNESYYKKYSAINDYTKNDNRGYWEIYSNSPDSLAIDYMKFDYRDPSSRKSEPIPDFDLRIFNNNILDQVKTFIDKNLNEPFDCIYYRYLYNIDQNHLESKVQKIKTGLDSNKPIFLTANSEQIKKYITNNLINKCITYKNINLNITDGVGIATNDENRAIDLAAEMIIMACADKIHYAGNHQYISLFNYYAHMVKRVPLIEY